MNNLAISSSQNGDSHGIWSEQPSESAVAASMTSYLQLSNYAERGQSVRQTCGLYRQDEYVKPEVRCRQDQGCTIGEESRGTEEGSSRWFIIPFLLRSITVVIPMCLLHCVGLVYLILQMTPVHHT
jgi:hypothetical protein